METGLNTISIVYNGDTMTKIEVMLYLANVIRISKEFHEFMARRDEYNKKIDAVKSQMKRRTYYVSEMSEPVGLERLFPSRMRAYKQWLADEPKRKKEKKKFEKSEDKRIADLQNKVKELEQERNEDYKENYHWAGDFEREMTRHIIAPEYRKDGVPEILLFYLFNGRAQTLTDAINLYHQELHWSKMEDIAKEQSRQAQAAYYRQESMLLEQAQMQREQLQEMQNTADQALAAAKSAEFYSEMNYLFNTYYNS